VARRVNAGRTLSSGGRPALTAHIAVNAARAGGRRRRAALTGAAIVAVAGCGTPPPDLFSVERSGADPNANVDVVVSDGGSVSCDGKEHALDGERLLRARHLVRDLAPQAELGIELPPGPGTDLSYRVALEAGSIAFSDRSPGVPPTFLRVAAFTKDVTERVCGIER